MESFGKSLYDMSFSSLRKVNIWFGNTVQAVSEPFRQRAATMSGRINYQSSCEASVNDDRGENNAPARVGILEQLRLMKDEVVSKTKEAMTWNKTLDEGEADICTLLTDKEQSNDINSVEECNKEILGRNRIQNSSDAMDFGLIKKSDVIGRDIVPDCSELVIINDRKVGRQKRVKGVFSSSFIRRPFARVIPASNVNMKHISTKQSLKVGELRMSVQCFQRSRQMKVILHRISDANLRKSTVFIKASIAFNRVRESAKSKIAKATNEGTEIIFKECVYVDLPRGKTDTNDYLLKLKLYKVYRLFRCTRVIGVAVIPFGHNDFFLDTTISVDLQHPSMKKVSRNCKNERVKNEIKTSCVYGVLKHYSV